MVGTTNIDIKLNTIEEAIDDIKAGKIIIVVDDEDRENEGDFICAAENITPETINFMATYGRGLICTPIEEKRAKELELELMVRENTAMHSTAFTVSIDLLGHGCTTGISAYDRATGIRAITNPDIKATDFARPGHIFPLIAKDGGVLRRTGHTEAAVDLARLAGLYPAGVLVEILNEDGTMARLPELIEISKKLGLKIITIKDLVAFRMKNERLVKKEFETKINSEFGEFDLVAFRQINNGEVHFALKIGDIDPTFPTLIKVHSNMDSSCLSAVFFDGYNDSIKNALEKISKEKNGVLLLMKHSNYAENIELIKQKLNLSIKSNTSSDEERDFGVGAQILRELGVGKLRLLSTSPKKKIGLIGYGLEIVEII